MGALVVREFAPAKLNLFLHVGEKRQDGFHDLTSLVAFADVGDELSFAPADDLTLMIDGPCAGALDSEPQNLVLRAARALASEARVTPKAKIVLTKNLPVASGIGGGSADAAATLRGLRLLWQLSISDETLGKVAASLGSDVPVCVASSTSWMEGRGERVTPAPALPPMAVVLANPGVKVPTASVFALLHERHGVGRARPSRWATARDLIQFLETTANDLEVPAQELAPIDEVLRAIGECHGALLVRMAGSGATCFGLFKSRESAEAARQTLSKRSSWWIAATQLR